MDSTVAFVCACLRGPGGDCRGAIDSLNPILISAQGDTDGKWNGLRQYLYCFWKDIKRKPAAPHFLLAPWTRPTTLTAHSYTITASQLGCCCFFGAFFVFFVRDKRSHALPPEDESCWQDCWIEILMLKWWKCKMNSINDFTIIVLEQIAANDARLVIAPVEQGPFLFYLL